MVVDRAEEHGLAQVGRRLLPERVGEAARGEPVVAALLRSARRMPAVLGRLRQVEEGEQLALRALEQIERKAVAGDDEEAGLLAGSGDLVGVAGSGYVYGRDGHSSGSTILS